MFHRFRFSQFVPLTHIAITLAIIIAATFVALFTPTNISAQGGRDWTAWMYNAADGSIAQVAPDGRIVGALYLPLPQAYNTYGQRVVVSPSGRYVAYSAYDSTAADPSSQLFVYDVSLGSILYGYDLADAQTSGFDFAAGFRLLPDSAAFDEVNGQFAFGYLREGSAEWRVVVGDLANGTEFTSLSSGSASDVTPQGDVPVVRRYDGQRVTFTMVPPGGASVGGVYPAFDWNIGTGELAENGAYATFEIAALPATGERLHVIRDEALPIAEGATTNVVEAITPDGERFTFYTDPEANLERAYFVEDGARVLVEVTNLATDQRSLRVLNRDGTVAGELLGTLENIRGVPSGYVGTFDSAEGLALAYIDTSLNPHAPVTLWTAGGSTGVQFAFVAASGGAPANFGGWGSVNE